MHTENRKYVVLRNLEIENFKGIRRRSFFFPAAGCDIAQLPGQGRTSIQDAWCWLLYGRDSAGSARTELRPLGPDGLPRDPLSLTQVAARIQISSTFPPERDETFTEREFRRVLRTEGELLTDLYVDGIPCRKTKFRNEIQNLLPEPLFYMLTDPLAFMENNTAWEKLSIAIGMTVSPFKIMKRNPEYQILWDAMAEEPDPVSFLKRIRSEKQELQRIFSDVPYRISELEETLRILGIRDYGALRSRRSCLADQRDRLLKSSSRDSSRLKKLNRQLADLDRSLGVGPAAEACGNRLVKLRKDHERRREQLLQLSLLERQFLKVMGFCAAESEEILNSMLQDVRVSLCSPEGELEFSLSLHGIPWRNLSSAEKQRAGRSFQRVLRQLFGVSLPVFTEEKGEEDPEVQVLHFTENEKIKDRSEVVSWQ